MGKLILSICALFQSPSCNVTTQARAPRHVEAQVRRRWPVGRPGPRPVHFAKRPSVRGGRERDAIKFWLLGWHGPVFEFELEFVLCGPRAQGARPAHPPLRNVHGDVLRQRGGVVAWCVLFLPLCNAVLCLARTPSAVRVCTCAMPCDCNTRSSLETPAPKLESNVLSKNHHPRPWFVPRCYMVL